MNYICYAAYSNDFIVQSEKIFKKLGAEVDLRIWDGNNTKRFIDDGIKVIIARGGTANKIRETLELPVVEIPVLFEDIIDALLRASKMGKKIGVIGYNNLLKGLDLLNPILNIQIMQVFAKDENDTKNQIIKLKEQGIDVIVGGVLQTNIAKEINLKYIRLDLSENSLRFAYNEAKSMLETILYNTRKNEELKAILNNAKEGYVAIDKIGNITLINQIALKLIPDDMDKPIGLSLRKVFPELIELIDVLKTGNEKLQETTKLKNINVLYNMIPLKLDNNEVIGAIATFNDINTITKGEYAIRNKMFNKGLYASYTFKDIKYISKTMMELIKTAEKFAKTSSTVLIVGETGVGKELFAQSIHNSSTSRYGPFVAVNCASIPESILESELFGYEEGAFTGAKKNGKAGLFELAHKGTIFLDEISEMPLSLQGRLLRVLQERKVMRLGSDQIIPIEVRVISATNKKLSDLVNKNKFREDLFYRLSVLTLIIPPLRDRKEDISDLAKEFLRNNKANTNFSIDALKALQMYSWPGNVRQLKNFIEKLSIIDDSIIISGSCVNNMISEYEPKIESNCVSEHKFKKELITKKEIEDALDIYSNNKQLVAEFLGIHRSTLWRLIKRYDI